MIRSLKNSAAGINALQSRIDAAAGNIAGVNTDAYKAEKPTFSDLVYEKMADSGRPVKASGENKPAAGSGSRQVAVLRDFSQGDLRETGRETDLAISGKGFFRVQLPDDSTAYTRNGNFRVNAEGQLVTQDGYLVYPEVDLPEGYKEILVDKNGKIQVTGADGSATDVADLNIYNFVNPSGLRPMGGNLFAATDESGPEEEGLPGQEGLGQLVQKSLESSNVDLASEMTGIMESQRAYQMNARALRMADDMWGMANNLRK